MKIKDLHRVDRSREKLARMGVGFLKDNELLAILLHTGTGGKSALILRFHELIYY